MPGAERASRDRRGLNPGLAVLRHGRMRMLGFLPHASNYTFLAELSEGDGPVLAVYKPRQGEAPLWDFPDGTLCRREVAAYLVAEELGWPRVPPTVLRDGPHGEGAVQLFVSADPTANYFTLQEDPRFREDFLRIAAFDVVAGNGDRKAGHCLLDADGELWSVDHGLCFNVSPVLRTVIWEFAGRPVPAELLEDVARLREELRDGPLRRELVGLLDPQEVDAAAERAASLVRAGRYPEPGPGRSVPWPPV
jgi:Phosphatidylinositol 3- and 4-kinase